MSKIYEGGKSFIDFCENILIVIMFFPHRQRLSEIGLKVADFERELDMIMLQIGERLN